MESKLCSKKGCREFHFHHFRHNNLIEKRCLECDRLICDYKFDKDMIITKEFIDNLNNERYDNNHTKNASIHS